MQQSIEILNGVQNETVPYGSIKNHLINKRLAFVNEYMASPRFAREIYLFSVGEFRSDCPNVALFHLDIEQK
jgi:hypothetical protein